MLQLHDKNKRKIAGLVNYENLCIESVLLSGDKTLSFSYNKNSKYYDEIVEEAYIRTKKDEFVIKARDINGDYTRFDCVLNLEELEANVFDRFESVEQLITASLNLAIVGTGWTVKDNTLKKKRTVRCTNKNALEIVQEIKKTYRVDIVFNTLEKQIEVYEHLGEDRGTYFIDSLNLTTLQVQSDSYKFATRIIAEGKDKLTFADINDGKNYVENFQYSKKIKTIYWKDERYTIKENLLEDAKAKLKEISKPFTSYNASILNLAELNPKYKNILDYQLGDTITLLSKNSKLRDKQRIVKTIEWPQDHTKDSVELANATLKFEDIQQENQETTSIVNNITTDNGTVDGSTIDSITTKQIEDFEANVIKVAKLKAILAEIENLHVNKADIQNLNAVIARIGTLEVTKASITELNAIHAIIQQIKAGKVDIADLNVAVAKVGILENKTAVLENALAGNLTADNFKTNAITAGSAVIAEGAIGSSQISSLSVNKLEAGDITTSKHRIVSADGTIEIVGNQILINRNNVNRVILGEYRKIDGTTDYGLLIRGKDGKTIMLDSDGVHNAGITNGAIDNNKVADNANISGNKLDINSVIREVNNNGIETIKGTKVTVGDRTLDVELSTQNNTITEHSKELSSQKASLTALDNALKFKVDSQTFTQSTTTINNNINRVKEEAINSSNSHADSKANEALNNAKAFVNSEITNVNTHLNKNTSEINILKGQIESKVSQSDIDKSIQNIKFNDVNMILNSGEFKDTDHWSCTNGSNNLTIENRILKFKFTNYASWGCYISNNSLLNKPLDISKKYTVVCKLKASKNQILTFNICDGNSYNYVFGKELSLTTEWQIFKFTFNPTQVGNERQFRFITSNLGYDFDLYIEFVKMVEGATSSDSWSMAPDYVLDNIKTVTNKISIVESKLTQENNSIKASVQDLNSTTQSITTNVSNINRDLTSKINSNLDAAKNFATDIATNKANTAKQEAISSANSHADNIAASKADEALNNAKAYTNAEITTINSKVHNVESGINILKDKINSKVSQSDIDKSISEIKLGGRNLILKSDVELEGTSPKDIQVGKLSDTQFITGKTVTVSLDLEFEDLSGGNRVGYEMALAFEDGSTQYIGCWYYVGSSPKTFNGRISSVWNVRQGRIINIHYSGLYIQCNGKRIKIGRPKIELGNKATDWSPAPEDLNQSIADNIKIVDSKISDVSSLVTQLRDSVTTQINSINSKTHSIETTLGGKASKQEVTEVNNRVATIKASLDSITQRVSSTESKAQTLESNINDKASKQEVVNINSRVTNVETNLNGITNRVSATESRINTLDGRVASAVTIQQFTEYKQSNRDFQLRVAQTTNLHNLVPNGTFAGGLREWICGGEFWSGPYTGYGFSGKVCGAVKNKSTSEKFLTSYKSFKVEKNTTYTLNFHYKVEQNIQSMEAFVMLSNTESGDYGQVIRVMQALGGERSDLTNDIPYSFTFNTGNFEWVWLRFDNNGMKPNTNLDEYCWLYISEVAVYKGNVGAVKYLPKGGETYDTTFKLDGMGYNCKFASGAWNQIGEEGNMWYAPGMKYPYRSLSYHEAVSINTDGSNNYIYRDVQLPARFDYVDPQYIDITASLKGWYKYTGKPFSSENITVSTGRVYRANGHTYAQVACRGCIRDNDTFTTEGLQVVATLHVTA
ncbi:phage tail protein [Clostridium perfringens]|nr:phage tail spike protein [Clostridium perfringens]MDU7899372.1 phage tail spike protein [Clostridium perfringens]DAW21705.1 MAG TPA: tail protein [Caudoviricetes sp.]